MEKRERAIKLIEDLRKSGPQPLIERIGKGERGIHFILTYLNQHKEDEVIASDLSRIMGVSSARMSVLLKKMEEKGLIEKKVCENDGRRINISLSAKGRRLTEEQYEKLVSEHMKLIDEIGEADIDNFLRISGKIKRAMKVIERPYGGPDEDI